MNWIKIVLEIAHAAAILITIATIGKERKPVSPMAAMIATVLNVLIMVGIYFA